MERFIGLLGMAFFLVVAFLMSNNKRKIKWWPVIIGVSLQFIVALLVMRTGPGRAMFDFMNDILAQLMVFTGEGTKFVFGSLTNEFSFALNVLPTVIFFSSLFAVLYYFGVLQLVIKAFAVVLRRCLNVSGAEALSSSASIFLGQTEAPLLVRPFIEKMTSSELLTIMIAGMAHISGGVMAAYAGMGVEAGALVTACVMNTLSGIVLAKIIMPETGTPLTSDLKTVKVEITDRNVLEAASRGASEGVYLAINIAAMLIAFIAFIYLFNFIIGIFGTSLEEILGTVLRPIAFLMGASWEDSTSIGVLLGKRAVLNEFIAYYDLGQIINVRDLAHGMGAGNILFSGMPFVGNVLQPAMTFLSDRSIMLASFALCGFANFSSIAIQIGGIGGMAPTRRGEIASLGMKAMIAGTMATCMSGAVALVIL